MNLSLNKKFTLGRDVTFIKIYAQIIFPFSIRFLIFYTQSV